MNAWGRGELFSLYPEPEMQERNGDHRGPAYDEAFGPRLSLLQH